MISSGGAGVLDVKGLVQQLMQIEAKRSVQLEKDKQFQVIQTNLYANLQGMLEKFKSSITNVASAFNTVGLQATSSNNAIVTAQAVSNDLTPGTHTIVVAGASSLAQAQLYTSGNNFASQSTPIFPSETLTFTNNSNPANTFSVPITTSDTLQTICSKINGASGNTGVSASIISSTAPGGAPQYSLSISARQTGTVNQFTISGDTGNVFNFNQVNAGTDAVFTFDGYNVVRSSNTITDVLTGLNFTLTGAGTATINVTESSAARNQAVSTALQDMVTNYNTIMTSIDGTQANPDTSNVTFPVIKSTLQNLMSATFSVSGSIHSLADIGIVMDKYQEMKTQSPTDPKVTLKYVSTGTLKIDTTQFDTLDKLSRLDYALKNNFKDLQGLFTTVSSGFADTVNHKIDTDILPAGTTGAMYYAEQAINTKISYYDTQLDAEHDRLLQVQDELTLKYTNLNKVLTKLKYTTDALQSQLDSWKNAGGNK